MWPSGFQVFKVSSDLAWSARLARDPSRREHELPQLDLKSDALPAPGTTFDREQAREAIGERFLALLAALAISCDAPGAKVLVAANDRDLAPDVRSALAEYFGLVREGRPLERFAGQLAAEFYQWVKTHPKERQDFGLELDSRGRIFLKCPDLQPDLEPLEE